MCSLCVGPKPTFVFPEMSNATFRDNGTQTFGLPEYLEYWTPFILAPYQLDPNSWPLDYLIPNIQAHDTWHRENLSPYIEAPEPENWALDNGISDK